MPMPRLLIASSSIEFSQSIAQALQGSMITQCCHNGKQALQLLRTSQPDILLIDLILPEMDGLAVLQAASNEHIRIKVIAALDMQSPYILNALTRLQVSYAVLKPCDAQSILAHLDDIAATLYAEPVSAQDDCIRQQTMTAAALLELGMNPKWNGFTCLVGGIPKFAADRSQTVTKELYADIGKPLGKNSKMIERNIRSAIQKAWAAGNMGIWRKYFPAAPDGTVPRPSNKAFIARLANILYAESRERVG